LDGKLAVVVVNTSSAPITATVAMNNGAAASLAWVSPEDAVLHPSDGKVKVESQSAVVVIER